MNIRQIRRIFALLVLTVSALAGAVAQAQSPLPLPVEGRGTPFQIILPIFELRTDDQFVWPEVNAAKYVIKAKNLATGATFKWTMNKNDVCGDDYCFFHIDADWNTMGKFFGIVKNGDMVKVTIVATHDDDSKSKSYPISLKIVETEAAQLNFPFNNMYLGGTPNFTWADVELPSTDVLIIKDAGTGKTVVKKQASAVCPGDVCSANPFSSGALVVGRSYVWFVKTTGATGETVKSEKWTFTMVND